ncbi:hypothetical protein [Pseudanabaena sp. PCC 6802]|nr:hypothetical protein [Pseudanabaena sp. PCC 6802]
MNNFRLLNADRKLSTNAAKCSDLDRKLDNFQVILSETDRFCLDPMY